MTKRLAVFVLLLAVVSLDVRSQVQESLLPGLGQVGAANLPVEIASVSAPFAMPKFARPKFPELRVELSRGDSDALATQTIQAAIDEVSSRNGGTVVIPKGISEDRSHHSKKQRQPASERRRGAALQRER